MEKGALRYKAKTFQQRKGKGSKYMNIQVQFLYQNSGGGSANYHHHTQSYL